MTQVGIVKRVPPAGTYCFLKTEDGIEAFAHVREFLNPESMQTGKRVMFTLVPTLIQGKLPTAMNVREIAA